MYRMLLKGECQSGDDRFVTTYNELDSTWFVAYQLNKCLL